MGGCALQLVQASAAQAGSQSAVQDFRNKRIFLLVTEKLVYFAMEFQAVPALQAFKLDGVTEDELSLDTLVHFNRLRIGMLLFHFVTFDRRVRVPLSRCWRALPSCSFCDSRGSRRIRQTLV